MVSRTAILILVASLMGSQGAPHQDQFNDRQFSGLTYGMQPSSQDYVAAPPAPYGGPATASPYAAPPVPANYLHPRKVVYHSAPAHNYPRPAAYQTAPQQALPSASYNAAPAQYQPAMSASAYPVSAPAAPVSYSSYRTLLRPPPLLRISTQRTQQLHMLLYLQYQLAMLLLVHQFKLLIKLQHLQSLMLLRQRHLRQRRTSQLCPPQLILP